MLTIIQTDLPSDSSSSHLPVASSASGFETRTTYNQQGFPTTIIYDPATATLPVSYDISGFPITSTPVPRPATTSASDVADDAVVASPLTTMQISTQSMVKADAMSSASATPVAVKSGADLTEIPYKHLLAVLAFALVLPML